MGISRFAYIKMMDVEEMAEKLLPMIEELCEDGVPGPDYMLSWLLGDVEEQLE